MSYDIEQIDMCSGFTVLPNHWDYDLFFIYGHMLQNRIFAQMYNNKTHNIQYKEFTGKNLNSTISTRATCIYDEQWDKVFFIGVNNNHEFLVCSIDENFNYSSKFLRTDSLFYELTADEYYLRDFGFSDIVLRKYLERDFKIEMKNGKYIVYFATDFWEKLNNDQWFPKKNINNKSYKDLTDYFSKYFSTEFSEREIWELINRFRRKQYYEARFYHRNKYEDSGLLKYVVLGSLDGNGDGINDILIAKNNDRWIASEILLYDFKNEKILWRRRSSLYIYDNFSKIVDLENDGEKEILVNYYSPCSEMPVEWFQNPKEFGYTTQTQFMILANDGEIKTVQDNLQNYHYKKKGYYKYNSYFMPEWNKIFLAMRTLSDFSNKKMEVIDLATGEKFTTDINYTNVIDIRKHENMLELYNLDGGILKRIRVNKNLEIVEESKTNIRKKVSRIIPGEILIKGQRYIVLDNMMILDDNLNLVSTAVKSISSPQTYDNKLIFIDNENDKLSIASFNTKTELNPWAIVLLLLEIILFLISLLVVYLIKLPYNSANHSYFVIYGFLGKLYYWQIKGDARHYYKLPKKFAFNVKVGYDILHELSKEHRLIYSQNYILFNYKVYELSTLKSLQIIQVLTHDLKNDILLHKIQIQNFIKEKEDKKAEEIMQTAEDISKAAIMLSNFMHINKMYKEEIKISHFIQNLEALYLNDDKYELLSFENRCHSKHFYVDKKLLEIAIKNLINNALRAVDNVDGFVRVIFKENIENHYIIIENPANLSEDVVNKFKNIGFTTKSDGSGIGIPIALEIIKNHNGKLNFYLLEGILRAEIILPNTW